MFVDLFDEKYGPLLDKRRETFRRAFELLEAKEKEKYLIVETGCVRFRNGFRDQGQSTVLFDAFVGYHDGMVFSVDLDSRHCALAKTLVSEKTTVICGDSVEFLWNIDGKCEPDLVYLDSMDLKPENPEPSMWHHFKEFVAVVRNLKQGCLLLVDDHLNEQVGKGKYIAEFLEGLGYERAINGYQIGWVL